MSADQLKWHANGYSNPARKKLGLHKFSSDPTDTNSKSKSDF